MAVIVGVHGIGQQLKGEHVLIDEWLPSLRSGLKRVGLEPSPDGLLSCAFYGDIFRPAGTRAGTKSLVMYSPPYDASDIDEDVEQELLLALLEQAYESDPNVKVPDASTKGPRRVGSSLIQHALNALSGSRFFSAVGDAAMAGIIERLIIADLKQVRAYMRDPAKRRQICDRIEQAITEDTRVVVGHSLGSIVAYECLCAHPEWPVKTLVTIGSPLAIPNIIFDRLNPRPRNGRGLWPCSVEHWFNIADRADLVALVKELRPRFDDRVIDSLVNNGATAHDVSPYLTAVETGRAIASGL